MTYQATNHSTQVEDHPEPGNVATLGSFGWVRHHNGALSAPQETGAHTEQRTSKGGETQVLGVVVAEIGSHIDGIANTAKGQGCADTELIGEGSSEKANNSEGRIHSRVGAVVCGRIELTSSTHTVQGIVHAWAHEADEGHDEQLHWRRCEPGHFVTEDGEAPVLPRVGKLERSAISQGMVGGGDIVARSCTLLVGRHFDSNDECCRRWCAVRRGAFAG
jgi:hypothetical protein